MNSLITLPNVDIIKVLALTSWNMGIMHPSYQHLAFEEKKKHIFNNLHFFEKIIFNHFHILVFFFLKRKFGKCYLEHKNLDIE